MKLAGNNRRILNILFTGLLIFAMVASSWKLLHIKPQENINGLVPFALREQIYLFQKSPLNRKVFVIVQGPDENSSLDYARGLQQSLLDQHLIKPGFQPSLDRMQAWLGALPFRWTEKDEQQTLTKLSAEAVDRLMAENYKKLISLEGWVLKPLLLADPLYLIDLMGQKFALLNPQTSVRYQNGFLTDATGRVHLGIYELNAIPDFAAARQMTQFFQQFSKDLPADVKAFFLGGLRYTAENVQIIQRDLWIVGTLAMLSLILIFISFLRMKQALLIYLLPLAVTPIAAWVTYWIFDGISGITLGFGSVVAGLSVDYAVYVFFALRSGQERQLITPPLKRHLLCTFTTSALCFVSLFISSVEVFRQIAVFALTGLLISLLIALYILPVYWKNLPIAENSISKSLPPKISKPFAWSLCFGVICLGVIGLFQIHFESDLNSLNATSGIFKQQYNVLQNTLQGRDREQALLFVKGRTREEALEQSERFEQQAGIPLAVNALFPSKNTAEKQVAQWQNFWNQDRVLKLQNDLEISAKKLGMVPAAFKPFIDFLTDFTQKDTADFSSIYDPFISLPNGDWAVTHMVPYSPRLLQQATRFGAILIAGSQLQQDLLKQIQQESLWVVELAFLLNFAAVTIIFRSIRKALLAFIPVLFAAGFTFACFWIFQLKINLFVLIFLPLLMGLGIDYAIFQLTRHELAPSIRTAYAPAALWVAALSTLAGFGVLIFARHSVLFMMGISSFLGIGSAMLSAQYLLPAILEKK